MYPWIFFPHCEYRKKIHHTYKMFEEIAHDSDVSDDCEIEIYKENFEDIEQVNHSIRSDLRFSTWWPKVAETVLAAMYSSKEAQKSAIRALVPLFDFQYTSVEPLRLATETVNELYPFYIQKLKLHESHVSSLKHVWCDILRTCAVKCKALRQERQTVLNDISTKANEMYKKGDGNPYVKRIVEQEFEKIVKEVEMDFEYRMKIAKLNYTVPSITRDFDKLNQIDEEIKAIASHTSNPHETEMIKKLEETFWIECQNTEYEMSKSIQRECEEYWMDGLT